MGATGNSYFTILDVQLLLVYPQEPEGNYVSVGALQRGADPDNVVRVSVLATLWLA